MALFDSGTPLANVALSDTFNTWRVRTNQINTQAAGLASNNTFTGTNNIFNGTLQATTANFTTLQADAIDFDGDLTVDLIAANTINAVAANFTTLQADAITFDGDLTVDRVTANTFVGDGSGITGLTSGTVTSVGGTGTVQGLSLSGTVTASGDLTLGGSLSDIDLTSQVTGTLPAGNGGTGVTSSTGSGSVVLSSSPSLVTPVLGTPSSGNLSNCTADGTQEVGFRNIPPVGTKNSGYTLAIGDVGKYVQVGSSGSITIPNSTFTEGDVISIFNNTSGDRTITASISTCYVGGTDSDVSSLTLATRGVATVLFISSTVCVVTGNV